MSLSVRRAGGRDREALVRLRLQLWPDDGPGPHRDELADLLPRADFAAFLALDDGEPVGFAEATLRTYVDGVAPGRNGYLEGIWVSDAHRRRGIGRALLAAVTGWARDEGCVAMGSDADIDNPLSHEWHAAMGFAEVGRTVTFARSLG